MILSCQQAKSGVLSLLGADVLSRCRASPTGGDDTGTTASSVSAREPNVQDDVATADALGMFFGSKPTICIRRSALVDVAMPGRST